MKTQKFGPKEQKEFNAFWLALKDRGFKSRGWGADLEPGQFSTCGGRARGYVVAWREKE